MGKTMRAIGLMSGTSLDGIDVAMIETDGEDHVVRGPGMTVPYDSGMRARLAEALAHARSITAREQRPGMLTTAERLLTEYHGGALSAFVRKHRIDRASVDVVGFHGQTVLHKPEARLTVQIGDARLMAEYARLPVVHDLRAADVAAGGQGAPLAPVYHRAMLARRLDVAKPVCVVNLGGVANVTYIGADGELIAFDTGPGNALLDDWMAKKAGLPRDENGAAARAGTVNEEVVGFYLAHEYFRAPPPKSLDRNAFFWDLVEWMSVEDGAATLSAFTAEALARSVEHFPVAPRTWVICGGGRHNATLMEMIAARVKADVVPAEAAGLDGDTVEAEAWAYLAVRSVMGLPITFPGTTGVPQPMTGGVLTLAPDVEDVIRASNPQ